MSLGSPLDTKEQVREAIDIVDLVGRYVQLKRRGRLYIGLCPWHDDTRPSLQVNPERQSFKCWVCDIGGDVFSFVMKMDGVSFPEALAMLADQAGIPLKPHRSPRPGSTTEPDRAECDAAGGEVPAGEDKRAHYRAMAWAEKQYHECLLHRPEAGHVRQYLEERGITSESARTFHLGFSPNEPNWILERAERTKARARILEAVGVLARSVDGSLYDRFRGRLLFSIRDLQDRPVGLGGRVLPESAPTTRAKYINSPETTLFTKSAHLYGQDVARAAMRKSGTALVMEGYTDVIIAHQFGFQNAVAVLGTALTERHVRTLKRFVDRIVLVLDGDEAGKRRAREVLELFVAQNVDLRILTLPEGSDPADFLQQHGAEAFSDLLATRAVDALEHAFRAETDKVDMNRDVHGASQALERLVSIVAKAPRFRSDSSSEDRFRQEKILQRLAASFRVPEEDVRRRLTALRRAGRRSDVSAERGPGGPGAKRSGAPVCHAAGIDPWDRELLELLIRHPECAQAARAAIAAEEVASDPGRRVYEAFGRLSDEGTTPTFERLMLEFDDPAIKSLLVELDETGRDKAVTAPESLLESLITSSRQRRVVKQRAARQAALRQGGLDEVQQQDVLKKIEEEEKARQKARCGISCPTDGHGHG